MPEIYAEKEIEIVRDAMFEIISNSDFFIHRLMMADMLEEADLAKKNLAASYRALGAVANLYELNMYKRNNPIGAVKLCEFVKDIVDEVRMKTRRHLAKIEFIGEDVTVGCNCERLYACVLNMLINALEQVDPDESTVKVYVKNVTGYGVVIVSDDGYGMKDADFAAFTAPDATGGLSVIARFCEHVGTAPIFETAENNGFSVAVRIPKCDEIITLNAPKTYLPTGSYSATNIYLAKIKRLDVKGLLNK